MNKYCLDEKYLVFRHCFAHRCTDRWVTKVIQFFSFLMESLVCESPYLEDKLRTCSWLKLLIFPYPCKKRSYNIQRIMHKNIRGVTTLTNAVWAILGLNLSRPGNLDHPPEFWGYIPGCPDFFLQCPGIIACFPEKFPSVPIPGEISRFPEQFWLCPETVFVRVVTPRKTLRENSKRVLGNCYF